MRTPQVEPGRRTTEQGHDLRGRAARRAAERVGDRAGGGQGGVRPSGSLTAGLSSGRGDQLRAPELGAAAGRRRGAGRLARPDRRARMPVLVPNARGLDRAIAKGVREIAVFGSATETFAQRNLNRSLDEQYAMFEPVVAGPSMRACGCGLRVDVLRRPVGGRRPVDQVVDAGRRLLDLGCHELSLGDTIGVGTPGHVERLLSAFVGCRYVRSSQLAVHFHDTYGQALSNALTALRHGVTTFDASAGGLGGCPYAESATGNLATEDLVWQLHGLGIETGVDLEALVATTGWMAEQIGKPPASRVVTALA